MMKIWLWRVFIPCWKEGVWHMASRIPRNMLANTSWSRQKLCLTCSMQRTWGPNHKFTHVIYTVLWIKWYINERVYVNELNLCMEIIKNFVSRHKNFLYSFNVLNVSQSVTAFYFHVGKVSQILHSIRISDSIQNLENCKRIKTEADGKFYWKLS